jgi:hypothetical protein
VNNVENAIALPGSFEPSAPFRVTPWGQGGARAVVWSPDGLRARYCRPGGGWPVPWEVEGIHYDGSHAHHIAHAPCARDWQPRPRPRGG